MITYCYYDISSDKLRAKVRRKCQRHGLMSIQQSVLAGEIDKGSYQALIDQLRLFDEDLHYPDQIIIKQIPISSLNNSYTLGRDMDRTLITKNKDTYFI